MRYFYLPIITVAFLPHVTGCVSERKEPETKVKVQDATKSEQVTKADDKDQALTAEIAKRSLLKIEIQPGVMIPPPKDEPIKVISPDEISIGIWRCNLKKRTFQAVAIYPDAPHHAINQILGFFERTTDGKWVAKVTESSSGG